MEAPLATPNLSVKNIELELEGKKFICKIQTVILSIFREVNIYKYKI